MLVANPGSRSGTRWASDSGYRPPVTAKVVRYGLPKSVTLLGVVVLLLWTRSPAVALFVGLDAFVEGSVGGNVPAGSVESPFVALLLLFPFCCCCCWRTASETVTATKTTASTTKTADASNAILSH